MGIQSTTITTLAIAAALALPGAAASSPLLSGYGAPGAGEQQLVGAEVVGASGGRSGGGGRGAGTGSSPQHSETQTQSSATQAAPGGAESSNAAGTAGPGSKGSGRSGSQKGAGSHVEGGQPADVAGGRAHHGERALQGSDSTTAGDLAAATSSSTLGLSSAQLLLIAIVACALIVVALVTAHLSRLQHTAGTVDRGRMKTGEMG